MAVFGARGLSEFVGRIVGNMTGTQLDGYIDNASGYAQSIRSAIETKADEHRLKKFNQLLDTGEIKLEGTYELPACIRTLNPFTQLDKTLYEAEDGSFNGTERTMATMLADCDGILWWHRIAERGEGEFFINGFINHYPDFLAMTNDGRVIVVETKGDHLKNEDSKMKLRLGRDWAARSAGRCAYYMVFDGEAPGWEGAYTLSSFKSIILNHLS